MNARHLSAELRRKSVAADALTALNKQLSAQVVETTHALAEARKQAAAAEAVAAAPQESPPSGGDGSGDGGAPATVCAISMEEVPRAALDARLTEQRRLLETLERALDALRLVGTEASHEISAAQAAAATAARAEAAAREEAAEGTRLVQEGRRAAEAAAAAAEAAAAQAAATAAEAVAADRQRASAAESLHAELTRELTARSQDVEALEAKLAAAHCAQQQISAEQLAELARVKGRLEASEAESDGQCERLRESWEAKAQLRSKAAEGESANARAEVAATAAAAAAAADRLADLKERTRAQLAACAEEDDAVAEQTWRAVAAEAERGTAALEAAREEQALREQEQARREQELSAKASAADSESVMEAREARAVKVVLEALGTSAAAREASLAEELLRERLQKENLSERLAEFAQVREDPEVEGWEAKWEQARDAAASARSECVALTAKLGRAHTEQEAATRREAEAMRCASHAVASSAKGVRELKAAREEGAKAALGLEQACAWQQRESQERDKDGPAKATTLRHECAYMRQSLQQRQELAATQISELQTGLQIERHARSIHEKAQVTCGGKCITGALIDAPAPPDAYFGAASCGGWGGAAAQPNGAAQPNVARANGKLLAHRAQLGDAERRCAEYKSQLERQRAKAEQLDAAMRALREQSEAQCGVWRDQLNTLRVRARTEATRVVELEQELNGLRGRRGSTARQPMHLLTPPGGGGGGCGGGGVVETPESVWTPSDGENLGEGFSFGSGSNGVLSAGSDAPARKRKEKLVEGVNQVKEGAAQLLSKVDSRMDRAFDRMDGLVKQGAQGGAKAIGGALINLQRGVDAASRASHDL